MYFVHTYKQLRWEILFMKLLLLKTKACLLSQLSYITNWKYFVFSWWSVVCSVIVCFHDIWVAVLDAPAWGSIFIFQGRWTDNVELPKAKCFQATLSLKQLFLFKWYTFQNIQEKIII